MTTPDDDFPREWLTHGPHVDEEIHRFVWKAEGLTLQQGKIVAQVSPKGRRPALYQWQSGSDFQILTQGEVGQNIEPSVYSSQIASINQERLELNLHTYTLDQVLPDCLLHALLEEAWSQFLEKEMQQTSSGSRAVATRPSYYASSQVAPPSQDGTTPNADYFTVQALHQRIKAGAILAYNYHYHHYSDESLRRSRRTTLPVRPNPYQKGGKIALYLLERLEGKTNLLEEEEPDVKMEADKLEERKDTSPTKPIKVQGVETTEKKDEKQSVVAEEAPLVADTKTVADDKKEDLASKVEEVDGQKEAASGTANGEAMKTEQKEQQGGAKVDADKLQKEEAVEEKAEEPKSGVGESVEKEEPNPSDGDQKDTPVTEGAKDETKPVTDEEKEGPKMELCKDDDVPKPVLSEAQKEAIANEEEEKSAKQPDVNSEATNAEETKAIANEEEQKPAKQPDANSESINAEDDDKADDTDAKKNTLKEKEDESAKTTETAKTTNADDEEEVVLINAHEEEVESVEDKADQDEDFDTNDEMEAEEEGDDDLEGVVKEQHQLDIEMEEGVDAQDEGEEEEDDDEHGDYVSNNPFLQPTPESLMDWMGRRGKSMGIVEIQEAVGNCLKAKLGLYDLSAIDQRALGAEGGTFVLDSAGEKWKDLKKYDHATFLRCKFRLKSDTEDEQEWFRQQELGDKHRKEKAWASWRFKGIHGGHTVWPAWSESVEKWIKDKKGEIPPEPQPQPVEDPDQAQSDEALAQSLATASAASRRSARRGNTKDGVFYGTQSQMSQKQLTDTIVRLCKQSKFNTLLGLQTLVGDDSSNPVHRLRTALGRVIWKRNQVTMCKVTSVWSDQPLWTALKTAPLRTTEDEETPADQATTACVNVLVQYLRQIHKTELQLRNIVLRQLTFTPISTIATAADERVGTLESFDSTDFEDPGSIEWKNSGHAFIGKHIFRPPQQPAGESSECRWFKIKDYVESVPFEGPVDERNDKGAALAERRMRFRAFPLDNFGDSLILTEAQVAAGIKAGEKDMELDSKSAQSEHPFAGGVGTKVSLRALTSTMECVVVGYDTVAVSTTEEGASESRQHKTLLLPESRAPKDAFWVSMACDEDGNLTCRIVDASESVLYKLEQPDYDDDSAAFQACRGIIAYLKNHKHANIFMEPVDPVALNIPTYFDIIKQPMDITTLSENLEKGLYSKIPPTKSVGRSAVSRMLNGPFRDDALLILDNAITFNPPDDWIHQTAKAMRKTLAKKIEQAPPNANEGGTGRRAAQKSSVYIDEDSDVDMYEYESDRDDEDFAAGQRAKKRKRKSAVNKDDVSLKATAGPVRLQKTLSETLGLRGPFASLPVISDANGFSLRSEWGCRHQTRKVDEKQKAKDEQAQKELEEILSLQRQAEESEKAAVRRSARVHILEDYRPKGDSSKSLNVRVAYHLLKDLPEIAKILAAPEMTAASRAEVEALLEQAHETYYAKLYQQFSKQLSSDSDDGLFANASFPPYLGRVVPSCLDGEDPTWEIRFEYVVPAVRWVIRGLIKSGHLTELEPLTTDAPFTSGVIMTSDVYYHDPANHPFDLLEIRRKKKGGGADESSEDEIELSEYELMRAERVKRNADRLKMLGLG